MSNGFISCLVTTSLAIALLGCGGTVDDDRPGEHVGGHGPSGNAGGASAGSGGAAATGSASSASSTAASTSGTAGGGLALPPCVDGDECQSCSSAVSLLCGPVCRGDSQMLFDSLAECACNGRCHDSCSVSLCSTTQVTQECVDCIDRSCWTELTDCAADA